jgi:hypothetical protein
VTSLLLVASPEQSWERSNAFANRESLPKQTAGTVQGTCEGHEVPWSSSAATEEKHQLLVVRVVASALGAGKEGLDGLPACFLNFRMT